MLLQILRDGLVLLDLTGHPTTPYAIARDSASGFGEAEIDAEYADLADRHGSRLASRRYRNRVVNFTLGIMVSSGGTDAREAARNAVADAIDAARRYELGDPAGTTAAEGEVVLKYRPKWAADARYARILDGQIGSSDRPGLGSASGVASDLYVPVTLILEPFWRPERDLYLRNCMVNGGFEAGFASDVPHGWSYTASGVTGAKGSSSSFVRSGSASAKLEITAAAGAGTAHFSQTVTLANVGLIAGQTVLVSAWVYLYSRAASAQARLTVDDGEPHSDTVTTTGSWQRLDVVIDIKTGATSFDVAIFAESLASGGTILTFWDEIQVQPHADNLLLGGGFTHDANSDGVADYWTFPGSDAGITALAPSLETTGAIKYGATAQQLGITASTGAGTTSLHQDVTLSGGTPNHNLKAGEAITFGAWLAPIASAGQFSAFLHVQFLDANGRAVTALQSSNLTLTPVETWQWLSATGAVPAGAITARCRIVLSAAASGATGSIRANWATTYRGHSDQSDRRWWPWTDKDEALLPVWSDGAWLTSDPAATDGKQIGIAHAGLPGNVPGPCRIVVGVSDEISDPLIVALKRGTVGAPYVAVNYSNISNQVYVSGEMGANTADADAITGNYRLWTPTNTTEKLLFIIDGALTPPGRYQIVLRVKLTDQTHYGRYSFRASNQASATGPGTWSPIAHTAPPWLNTSGTPGYELWPAGIIPMPLRSRLPSFINASRFGVWGRVSDPTTTSIRIDGAYFLPLDGYFKGEPSYYFAIDNISQNNRYTTLIDSITPLPGGLTAYTNGTFPPYLPAALDDQPDAEEEPIYLGESGKLVVIHSGAAHVKTRTMLAAILARPWWTTGGATT